MPMPFGKYKDRRLIDLPEHYLLWFEKQGFPNGNLGQLMQLALEIQRNGLSHLLSPLKNPDQKKQGNILSMTPDQLIKLIKTTPDAVSFEQVINTIQQHFIYTPTRFRIGNDDDMITNDAGVNEGSCKIFAFAKLLGLNKTQTLACFGDYYRHDVLVHPDANDHPNIRAFIKYSNEGVQFDNLALKKNTS